MRLFKTGILLLLMAFVCLAEMYALDAPKLRERVNDLAEMMTTEEVSMLESKLKRIEEETSNQIAILTIPSLEGEVLEEFSIRVVEKWKLGQKDKDNGLLILLAQKERKIRIEVGYGLEGTMTDAISGRIIDHVITPNLRADEGRAFNALDKSIDMIEGVIAGEFTDDDIGPVDDIESNGYGIIVGMIMFVVYLFFTAVFGAVSVLLGAIVGMVIALCTGILLGLGIWWVLILAVAGFFVGLAIGLMESGGGFGGGGYGGGGYGGGGYSGGSSGGFSGGGGSFGGGGASGSW